jgi:hypothetical protein
VVETTDALDLSVDRGVEALSGWGYPVDDGALQSLHVIGAGCVYAFLDLKDQLSIIRSVRCILMHEVCY